MKICTSDFSINSARLLISILASADLESIPCKPARAILKPLELNIP
jgi:hypothetical protein